VGYTLLPLRSLFDLGNVGSMQIQEIWTDTVQGKEKMKVGTIYYTLRMKKSLKDAIVDYEKNRNAAESKYITSNVKTMSKKKIVQIVVESGSGIKVKSSRTGDMVSPFFSYEFYEFEFTGSCSNSANPVWNEKKTFEVEDTDNF
jgi:hypothetical protein